MARRRMISKTISTSVKLSRVSDFAALLFTWSIPHTDDFGRMDGEAISVRGIVVPMRNKKEEEIEAALQELAAEDLIKLYDQDNNRRYMEVVNFDDHQTLKNDRGKQSEVPAPKGTRPPKLTGHKTAKWLVNIPDADVDELKKKVDASEKQIRSKGIDLKLYCESKGRQYKNYKSFLLNALRKDFGNKKVPLEIDSSKRCFCGELAVKDEKMCEKHFLKRPVQNVRGNGFNKT